MLLKINIKLNIILIILLITSLGFNFRFRVLLQTARLQMNEISLNPVNLKRYPQENIATEKIMVMFGDSRIVAWRKPQLEDFLIINRGISGETSSQALLRFDYHVSYLQPKIILIQVGVNDLRMRTITTDRQEIIADCKHNIRSIVQKSLELDSLVILTTIFPLGEGNIPSQFTTIWPSKAAIVTAIEEVNRKRKDG